MTIRTTRANRICRWTAAFGLAMLGLGAGGIRGAWAQSPGGADGASTQPSEMPPRPAPPRTIGPATRPGNIQEYRAGVDQRRAEVSTRPEGGTFPPPSLTEPMRLDADRIRAANAEKLKELEAAARASVATGTRPAPPPGGTAAPGTTVPPTVPMNSPPVVHQPTVTPPPVAGPANRTGRPGGAAPVVPGAATPTPGATSSGINPSHSQAGPDLKANPNWWQVPPEDRPYFVNWNKAKFEQTLKDISEMSGMTVVPSQIPPADLTTKEITFQSQRVYSFDEFITLYNELIFDLNPGYWLIPQSNYLVVRPLSEWYRHIPPGHMYASLEEYRAARLPKWDVASMMYAPKYELPEVLANDANDLVPLNGARAVVKPSSGRIVLTGFVYFIDDQLEIMIARDIKQGESRELRAYKLNYTSPEDASKFLKAMLPTSAGTGASVVPPPGGGQPGPGGRPTVSPVIQNTSMNDFVEIQEDQRSNQLLIKATPVKHELVKEYLEKYIDVPMGADEPFKVFQLKHADPEQVADIIKPLLGRSTTVAVPQPQPQPGQPNPQPPPPGRGGNPQQGAVVMPMVTVGSTAVLMPLPQTKSLLVKAKKDELVQIEKYITLLDVEEAARSFEFVKLEHASASVVAQVLRDTLGMRAGGGRFSPNEPAKTTFLAVADTYSDKGLVLKGDPKDMNDARELIKKLDVDPEADAVQHVVQLKDADPDFMANLLQNRYGGSTGGGRRGGYSPYGGYGGGGGGGSSLPKFIADGPSKTLLVLSTEQMWPEIDRLIRDIEENSQTRNVTKLYPLQHASPESLANILGQALGGTAGGGRSSPWGSGYMGLGIGKDDRPSFQYQPGGKTLVVTATDETHAKVAELVAKLDVPGPYDNIEPRPIQLVHADAQYVADAIEEQLRDRRRGGGDGGWNPWGGRDYGAGASSGKPQVRAIAEVVTNRVFVIAADEDFKKAEALAKSIEDEYAKVETVSKTFVLENASPSDVRDVLEAMFDDSGGGRRRRGRSGGWDGGWGGWDGGGSSRAGAANKPSAVRVIDTDHSLMVTAPKSKMPQIEAVIEEMDTDPMSQNIIKTYRVEGPEEDTAQSIARTLSRLYGLSESGGGFRGEYGGGGGGGRRRASIRIVADYDSDVLMVSAPPSKMPEIDQRVQELLKLEKGEDLSFVIQHFDVRQALPEDVAALIEPMIDARYEELRQKSGQTRRGGYGFGSGGNRPRVVAHKDSRRILVSAPKAVMPLVEELLKEFDQPPVAQTTKIVTLKTAKAQEVVPAVRQMLAEGRGSGGGMYRSTHRPGWGGGSWDSGSGGARSGSEGEVQLTAIESSNLIVMKGPLDRVIEAEELIKQLDSQALGDGPIIEVIPIRYASIYDVVETIEDMVAGGSSDGGYSSFSPRRPSGAGAVIVKTDFSSNQIIVSTPRDKLPMIKHLVEVKEAMAEQALKQPDVNVSKTGELIGQDRGEITKLYEVKGDANETARQLDKVLLSLIGFSSPYVKAFPFANQIIISGKPEHFKLAEEWLARFERNPIQARTAVVVKKVKVDPETMMTMFQGALTPDQQRGVMLGEVRQRGKKDPLKLMKEIDWQSPPVPPATQPATGAPGTPVSLQPAGAAPFVAPGELADIRTAVRAAGWSQVTASVATQPSTATRPSAATQPSAGTRPAGNPPAPGTRPAAVAAEPATSPAPVAAEPATRPAAVAAAVATLPAAVAAAPATRPVTVAAAPTTQPVRITVAPTTRPAPLAAALATQPAAAPAPPPVVAQPMPAPVAATPPVAPTPAAAPPAPTPAVARTAAQQALPPGAEDVEAVSAEERMKQNAVEAAFEARRSGQVQIRYDPDQKVIYLAGPDQEVQAYTKLLEDIETSLEKSLPDVLPSDIRVFELTHVDVNIAAAILENMFNDKPAQPAQPQGPQPNRPGGRGPGGQNQPGQGPNAGQGGQGNEEGGSRRRREEEEKQEQEQQAKQAAGGQRIRVFADARTRTIIVRAAQEDFPKIAELVLKIDRPGDPQERSYKIFQLKKLNAYEVEMALKAVLKIEDPRLRGGMLGRGFPGRMGGVGGLGGMNAGNAEMMIAQLQEQMLEMELASTLAADAAAQPGQPGQEGQGTHLKLNPSKDISLTSDATTNTIIVTAPKEGLALVEKLINDLETQTIPLIIETFPIIHGDAEEVAGQLRTLFQSGAGGRGGGGRGGFGGPGGFAGGFGALSGFEATRSSETRITADPRTNTIIVKALEPDMEKIRPIIKQIDSDKQGGKFVLYPVQNADANVMATNLTKLLGQGGRSEGRSTRIAADAATNTIMVWAPEAQQKEIAAQIKSLDEQAGGLNEPKEIQMMFASAESVADKLEEIFVGGGRTGQRIAGRVSITGDNNAGKIFVRAPEDLFAKIQQIAKTLDQPGNQTVQVYPLKYAYASEVLTSFTTLLQQLKMQLGAKASQEVIAVTADTRTNALVVAGSKTTHVLVESVLQKIDTPPTDTTAPMSAMFGLTKSSAAAVAASINQLFAGQKYPSGVTPPTAVPEPNSNVVFVYGTKAQLEQIKATIITPLEDYKDTVTGQIKEYQIPVKYLNVEEAANTLSNYFVRRNADRQSISQLTSPADRALTIVADPIGKQLLVSASDANKKLIDDYLAKLDTPEATGASRQVRVFPLMFADPSYTVQVINTAFQRAARTSESEIVTATPEMGTLSVVVRANAENMAKVEALINELERPDRIGKPQTVPIEIQHAEAEDIAEALQQIYTATRTTNRGGRPPASFTVPRGTRRIMVTATPGELEEVKKLIAQMDVAGADTSSRDTRVVKVEHVTPEEMNTILTEYMRKQGVAGRQGQLVGDVKIMTSASAGAVVLTGPKDRLDQMEQLATKIDQSAPPAKEQSRQTRVFTLTSAEPSSVASVIAQSYAPVRGQVAEADRVVAVAEWATNSVVVTAKSEKLEEVQAMIERLDKKDVGVDKAIVPLKFARAEDLANVLRQTWQGSRRVRQGDPPVVITGDSNSNSVVVSAGPADLIGIKQMIADLDKEATLPDEELRIIPLQYIDANETLAIMTEHLRKPGGTRGASGSALIGDVRLQASATMNAMIVSGSQAQIDSVEAKLRAMDKDNGGGTAPRIIPINKGNAAQIAQNLTRIFTDPARQVRGPRGSNPEMVPIILADEGSNSLIVRAKTVDFNMIQEMAEKLDTQGAATGFKIIPVRPGADPWRLAQEMERVVNQGEQNRVRQTPGARAGQVSIGVDPQGRALLVSGSPELFEMVEQMVQGVAAARTGGEGDRIPIFIPTGPNTDPQMLKRVIEQWSQPAGGRR